MNQEKTLALYHKGRDAWNAWVKVMQAQRDMYQPKDNNLGTQNWITGADADFFEHTFETDPDFSDFLFPGDAVFTATKFADDANFMRATFSGHACFEKALSSKESGLCCKK